MIISAVIFYLVDFHPYTFSLGRRMSHCTQDPLSSFPCYAIYDFFVLIVMGGICILSLFITLVKIVLYFRNHKKK